MPVPSPSRRAPSRARLLDEASAEAALALTLEELGQVALPLVQRALGVGVAALVRFDAAGRPEFVAGTLAECAPEVYFPTFFRDDPVARSIVAKNVPLYATGQHLDRRTFAASDVYHAYYRPRDIGQMLAARLAAATYFVPGMVMLGLFRGAREATLGDAEIAGLAHVSPAFDAAARRARRLAALGVALPGGTPEERAAELAHKHRLTPAETAVLLGLGRGESNAEIGRRLFVSVPTVKTHVHRVLAKLGVSSRLQAGVRVR